MSSRIPAPHVYVNLHQTLWVGLAIASATAFIFDFKGVRKDVCDAYVEGKTGKARK